MTEVKEETKEEKAWLDWMDEADMGSFFPYDVTEVLRGAELLRKNLKKGTGGHRGRPDVWEIAFLLLIAYGIEQIVSDIRNGLAPLKELRSQKNMFEELAKFMYSKNSSMNLFGRRAPKQKPSEEQPVYHGKPQLHPGRWIVLNRFSRSGKMLFVCATCGKIQPTPDKVCRDNVHNGVWQWHQTPVGKTEDNDVARVEFMLEQQIDQFERVLLKLREDLSRLPLDEEMNT